MCQYDEFHDLPDTATRKWCWVAMTYHREVTVCVYFSSAKSGWDLPLEYDFVPLAGSAK